MMNLVERAKSILKNPKSEWTIIKNETTTVNELFTQYAVIMALIPAIASFIGYSLIGVSVMGVSFKYPMMTGLLQAGLTYILGLVGLYVLGMIVDNLAPSFGSTKDLTASMKVVVFSYTASWVGGILMIIPSLTILAVLFSIYSLYLMFIGIKTIKEPPAEKLTTYFVVTLLVSIVVYVVIGAIVAAIALGGMAKPF